MDSFGRAFPTMLFCLLCDFAMRRELFLFFHRPFVFFGPVLSGGLYQSVLDRCCREDALLIGRVLRGGLCSFYFCERCPAYAVLLSLTVYLCVYGQ